MRDGARARRGRGPRPGPLAGLPALPGLRRTARGLRPPSLGALQFNLLTALGLREHHYLLDIGCGSLRAGRLLIPYLLPGRYYGIEPETWLVEEGIERELGRSLVEIKRPSFNDAPDFGLSRFGRSFDFLIAQSIFSHAPAVSIERCLAEARKVMHESSIFAATFVEGDENYAGERWAYQGDSVTWTDERERRGSVTYTFEFLRELASGCGLACRRLDWPHPRQRWIALTLPGSAVRLPALDAAARIRFLESELARLRRAAERGPLHSLRRMAARLAGRVRPRGPGGNSP